MKKRRNQTSKHVEWILARRWVTGETAVVEQEDIDNELFELAR